MDKFLCLLNAKDVDNDRIRQGPLFSLVNTKNSLLVCCIGSKTVHGLCWKCYQLIIFDQFRCFIYLLRRKNVDMVVVIKNLRDEI